MMNKNARACAVAALLSHLVAMPSQAEDVTSQDLVIIRPWSRATPGGAKVAGGYLTIENRSSMPERLLSASTTAARRTEIHEMTVRDGIMIMRPADGGVAIAPGQTVRLAPGGAHLMFEDLTAQLRQGDAVPVTLTFAQAGSVKVSFEVLNLGARGPERAMDMPKPAADPPAAPEVDDSFFTHLHAVKAMANVTVSPGRAGPVEIVIQLENADEMPLAAQAVSVTLGNPEGGIVPVTAQAERISADQWRAKMSAPLPGRWSLGLGITISPFDIVNVASPILLR